ncbi:MAG TPA: class I adenylate-forming enzyme family protein, partial [Methylobacter sp.]
MQGSLIEKIVQTALKNPSAEAFVYKDQVVNYQQLYRRICQYAKALHTQGITSGDAVGISISQSPLHPVVMLALARLGAISVPINPIFPADIKSRIIEKYTLKVILTDLENPRVEGASLIRLQGLSLDDNANDLDFISYQPDADTPLLIAIPLLMSMSSGAREPKAIMYSNRYMIERMQKTVIECSRSTRMIPANLNFTMGYICTLGLLSLGGTIIFPDSTKAADVIKTINGHKVTNVFFSSEAATAIDTVLPAGRI